MFRVKLIANLLSEGENVLGRVRIHLSSKEKKNKITEIAGASANLPKKKKGRNELWGSWVGSGSESPAGGAPAGGAPAGGAPCDT